MDIRTHLANKDLIEKAILRILSQRTGKPREYTLDSRYRKPHYVVRMSESLAALLRDMGAADTQTEDVLAKDSLAAGHSDYVSKLALYCAEILIPSDKVQQRERAA